MYACRQDVPELSIASSCIGGEQHTRPACKRYVELTPQIDAGQPLPSTRNVETGQPGRLPCEHWLHGKLSSKRLQLRSTARRAPRTRQEWWIFIRFGVEALFVRGLALFQTFRPSATRLGESFLRAIDFPRARRPLEGQRATNKRAAAI